MNVYVAGRMSDPASLERVRRCMRALETWGHTIALDWTEIAENGPDEDLSPEVSREIALRERDAVWDADVLVIFHEDGMLGALIEAGIAIPNDIPILVVPCGGRATIWWHLPCVEIVPEDRLIPRVNELEWGYATTF